MLFLPLFLPLAASLKLVSQTMRADLTSEIHAATTPFPKTNGTVLLAADADNLRLWQEANITTGEGPLVAHSSSGTFADLPNRRVYSYYKAEAPGRPATAKCSHVDLSALKDVGTVRKCIEDALQTAKPVGEAGGLAEYHLGGESPGQTDTHWFFDQADLLRVLKEKKVIPAPAPLGNMTNIITLNSTATTAGADDGLFKVPSRWGDCETASPDLPMPHGAPPAVMSVLQCAGLIPSSGPMLVLV